MLHLNRLFLASETCAEGWVLLGESCYYISTDTMNWHSAVRRCMDFDSHLVIIDNQKEQNLLKGMNFENVDIYIIGLYSTFSDRVRLPLLEPSVYDPMTVLTTCVGCCIK